MMETKVCKKCGIEKPLEEFEKNKNMIDGRTGVCKICINKRKNLKRIEKNKDNPKKPIIVSEEVRTKRSNMMKKRWENQEYRDKMCKNSADLWQDESYRNKVLTIMNTNEYKEKISKSSKGRVVTDETKIKMSNSRYNNKQVVISGVTYNSITQASKELNMARTKVAVRLQSKNFKEYSYLDSNDINLNKNAEKVREYRKRNKDRLSLERKNRSKSDLIYKLNNNIRCSITATMRRNNFMKKNKTIDILGCTIEEFKIYIESKFEPWMNWENYGNWNGCTTDISQSWDLDHIIPTSLANTEEELIKLNHYTNFQPLCSYVNRYVKRDNI